LAAARAYLPCLPRLSDRRHALAPSSRRPRARSILSYVEREYGADEAARHQSDFETLGTMRVRALAVAPSVSLTAAGDGGGGRRELLRYARQLRSAEGRVPVGPALGSEQGGGTLGDDGDDDDELRRAIEASRDSGGACVSISFTWFDAFCPAKVRTLNRNQPTKAAGPIVACGGDVSCSRSLGTLCIAPRCTAGAAATIRSRHAHRSASSAHACSTTLARSSRTPRRRATAAMRPGLRRRARSSRPVFDCFFPCLSSD
jgi:hypothetical protein